MRKILAIARYTFREAVRNKVLYSIIFFAIVLILLSVVMGTASLSQDERLLKDIGLFAISFFSDMIAIFLGVTMLFQEIERKTIFNVLSKPVARPAYFLGKFSGMALTLLVQLVVMALALILVMAIRGDALGVGIGYAFGLIYVRCIVVVSIALLFSSFSTPYVSGFLSLGVWVVGGLIQELANFLPRIDEPVAHTLLTAIVRVAPDLNIFNVTTQLTYGFHIPLEYVLNATLYGVTYAAILLVAGALIFNRRDFI